MLLRALLNRFGKLNNVIGSGSSLRKGVEFRFLSWRKQLLEFVQCQSHLAIRPGIEPRQSADAPSISEIALCTYMLNNTNPQSEVECITSVYPSYDGDDGARCGEMKVEQHGRGAEKHVCSFQISRFYWPISFQFR